MTVYRAAAALTRYQVASLTASGLVVASPGSAALEGVVAGLVSAAVMPGQRVDVIGPGSVVTNPSWSWSAPGVAIYVGSAGALTETAPSGWQRVIAYAVDATSILVVPAEGAGGGGGGGLPPDGDYGDVAVSSSGTAWTVEASATANLSTFTSGAKGLAPASGGGTSNFLRADGSWSAPAGSWGGNIDGGTPSSGPAVIAIDGGAP